MRRAGVVVCALPATMLWATGAEAGFSATDSAAMNVTTAALAAPTSLSGTGDCAGPLTPEVDLSWTATTSTFATGYAIRRRLVGGTYVTVGTVTGRTTTTYTDLGPLAPNTQYEYVVRAVYASWTADSASASATTPLVC